MRTEEQKTAFARECARLEKAGGDVLEYIEKNWPSYTPRGTWFNLQKEYLHRSPFQLTDGKPVEKPVKNSERKEGKKVKKNMNRREIIQALIEEVNDGKDAFDVLKNMGYVTPYYALRDFKIWAVNNDPDLNEQLAGISVRAPERKRVQAKPAPAKKNPSETKAKEQKPPETVVRDGKEYEKLEPAPKPEEPKETPQAEEPMPVTVQEKPITTCCAPARESGVTVPDEIPEKTKKDDAFKKVAEAMKKVAYTGKTDPEPMEVVGVRSRVKGYYMKAEVNPALVDENRYVHLIWRDLVTRDERSIGLSVEDWMKLAEEIPQAMKQLGF